MTTNATAEVTPPTTAPPPTAGTGATKDLSGVAWTAGSLVGSLNPANHGFRTADGAGGYIIHNTHR